jgi:hypothetical protein
MIVHRIAFIVLFFCAAGVLAPKPAHAHGSVLAQDDLCLIKVNYLSAHFKVYQPREAGHKQYCEDLPVAAESVFVMEYAHDELATMPIDFRIVHDVTGKGRFARIEDVEAIADLDAVTVFYRTAVIEPNVYTVVHTFTEEGSYIGVVSARHPETGKVYAAVFPFDVGFTGWGYWPFFIGLFVLIQLQYLYMSGRLTRWLATRRNTAVSLLCCLCLLPLLSRADDFVVTYSTPDGVPEINRIHSWILHVETSSGRNIEGATISVSGGMPEHDHGLPTKPRVTADLGNGDYRLDGMRFHMSGTWEVTITITTDTQTSTVTVLLQL